MSMVLYLINKNWIIDLFKFYIINHLLRPLFENSPVLLFGRITFDP